MSDRIMLNVIVDVSRTPGPMYSPDVVRMALESLLLSRMGGYNPVVMLAPEDKPEPVMDQFFGKKGPVHDLETESGVHAYALERAREDYADAGVVPEVRILVRRAREYADFIKRGM